QPDGAFPAEAVDRLNAIGEWMAHSGESICGVSAGPHPSCFYGPMTRRGNVLYLHVMDPPTEGIEVRGINAKVEEATLLRTGEALGVRYENRRIRIDLRPEHCDPSDTVVALRFGSEPDWPKW